MKILIVEDEKKTGEYLTKGLTEAGFVVDLADNGLNGYHLAMTSDYDLLIPRHHAAGCERLGYRAPCCAPPGKACRSCCLPRWAPLSIG
ncbi:DNA-binding transcriptional activator CusR [Klebsiella pneumoniae]|uniref:DNA-binding transcriptional activator CusR n=1 Tax=Klebsiella pneumoniae TaxID=573 RepID=A0A378FUM6_KLEPN|nr:DNA-binding transcriptional activator CusR [Klebsiella pneumoniae]